MKLAITAALTSLMTITPLFAQEASAPVAREERLRQTAQSFEIKLTLNYLRYLPTDYENGSNAGDKEWPLLVFLHGAGENGDDLDTVKRFGPPKRVADGADFPFVMISPQCPKGSFWNTKHLVQLINNVIEEHNVDPDRVYLTGLSMGGFGSWALAAQSPEMFAAVAPVCGGGDPRTAESLKDLPIWAFHGDADPVVPASASQKMVDAIKEAGGTKVKLTLYEGVGHDSWTETYANEELFKWFLQHRR